MIDGIGIDHAVAASGIASPASTQTGGVASGSGE